MLNLRLIILCANFNFYIIDLSSLFQFSSAFAVCLYSQRQTQEGRERERARGGERERKERERDHLSCLDVFNTYP